MRRRRRSAGEHHVHLPRHQVRHCGCHTLVRDVHHVDASHGLEPLHRNLVRSAIADGGEVELAGVGLGQRHQVAHCLHVERRPSHQHERQCHELRDGLEVLECVKGQLGKKHRVKGGVQADGVAIRCRLGQQVGAQYGAGAWLVVDHHRLPQALRHARRDHARHYVRAPTRWVGNDEADGLGRVGLGPCSHGRRETGKHRQQATAEQPEAEARQALLESHVDVSF